MNFDVLILGGGPAGTAAAIVLARYGLKVAVIERTAYDAPRIGETFPPEICVPLQRLGVWETFSRAGHLPSPGIVSCWGSSIPIENDFLFNPYGCGWHVDRPQFDRLLADAAQQQGASIFLITAARRCYQDRAGWIVDAERNKESLRFSAVFVVDAAGRTLGPGWNKIQHISYDRLIGIYGFFDLKEDRHPADTRTIIESCREGWWYSAPLPDRRAVVAFMTDADLVPNPRLAANHYLERLRETGLTRCWLSSYSIPQSVSRFAANTYWRPAVAATRLAAGDAVMTFDPLSSQGVLKALNSGQAAAESVISARSGNQAAFQEYIKALERSFQDYLLTRYKYYQVERRWPQSRFWQRRLNVG